MLQLVMREKKQSRGICMNFRKSKLFQREKMQPIRPKDYPKVAAIVGIIVIPPILLMFI